MKPPEEFDENTVQPVVRRRRGPATPEQGAERAAPPPAGGSGAADGEPAEPAPGEPGGVPAQPSRTATAERRRPPRQAAPAARQQTPPAGARPAPGPGGRGRRPAPLADEEYVVLPAPTSGGRRLLAVGGIVLLVLGILVGGLLVWASRQIDPSGDPGDTISSVVVPSGASTDEIATILADEDVISSARMFRYYVGWKGAGPWEAGEYVDFRTSSSFDEAIEVLDEGPIAAEASVVRITEGTRLIDALAQISEQFPAVTAEQLSAALESGQVTSSYKPAEVTSWEGLLFPDTYEFEQDATPELIMQTMATKMEEVLDGLGYDKAETLQGRSAYELVTIASLIEKETGAPPEERGMISRVISNRLDDGETLGIDASVLYGLGRSAGELTQSDLDTETPYNTRLVAGLPPTPIALPGEASLAAAIAPSEGDWRYYVLTSNDPPTHFFTDSYDEFLDARDDARERGVF